MQIVNLSDVDKIKELISKDEPVFIIKNFEKAEKCDFIKREAHLFCKNNEPRLGNRFLETFYQIDVLPSGVETDRIFRSLCIYPEDIFPIVDISESLFTKMYSFQKTYLGCGKYINGNVKTRPQILHYPQGGGWFDWHKHLRKPTNYGLIVNLSKKHRDFNTGQTEVVNDDGELIKVDDYADIGDLILFRYDLLHRVAPCDPEKDLAFSLAGRWTAVLPIMSSEI